MKPGQATLMMAAILASDDGVLLKPVCRKPEKPCLNCGTPHRHNNSYCSPECCKEYKQTLVDQKANEA